MANKSVIMKFSVTTEEQSIILVKAKKSNMNLRSYLSFPVLVKEIVVFKELNEFAHQLSKVGTNLNQLRCSPTERRYNVLILRRH